MPKALIETSRSITQSIPSLRPTGNPGAEGELIFEDEYDSGAVLRRYEFHAEDDQPWPEKFHPHSLSICLNYQGTATLLHHSGRQILQENECAIFTVRENRLLAKRTAGETHCFYILELSCAWIRAHLNGNLKQLAPPIRRFVEVAGVKGSYLSRMPIPTPLMGLRTQLVDPPVPYNGRDIWLSGKLFEILSYAVSTPGRATSSRDIRNRDRIERVRQIIDENIATPPSLESIAKEVGCSMFHLSRLFKEGTGMNISDYQRSASMETAARSLRRGMSVAETARAAGYRSVSAFIRVFQATNSMTPGQWVARMKEFEQQSAAAADPFSLDF